MLQVVKGSIEMRITSHQCIVDTAHRDYCGKSPITEWVTCSVSFTFQSECNSAIPLSLLSCLIVSDLITRSAQLAQHSTGYCTLTPILLDRNNFRIQYLHVHDYSTSPCREKLSRLSQATVPHNSQFPPCSTVSIAIAQTSLRVFQK